MLYFDSDFAEVWSWLSKRRYVSNVNPLPGVIITHNTDENVHTGRQCVNTDGHSFGY